MARYINMVSQKDNGKLISKNISNVNPEATDEQIEEFVKVFAGLSDNTLKSAQKIIAQNLRSEEITIEGTDSGDSLYSNRYAATIDAKGGNDTVVLDGAIKNVVNLGAGNDAVSITGGANKNTITGDSKSIYFYPNRKNNINYVQNFTDNDKFYVDSLLSYTDSVDGSNVTIFANDGTLTSALVILGRTEGTLNVDMHGFDVSYKIGTGLIGINETYTVSDTVVVGTVCDDTLTFINSARVTVCAAEGTNVINGDGGGHTYQHKLGGNEIIYGYTPNDSLQFVNVNTMAGGVVDGDYSLQCYDSSTVILKNYTEAPNIIEPVKVTPTFAANQLNVTIGADGNHITTDDGTTGTDGVLGEILCAQGQSITSYASKITLNSYYAATSIQSFGDNVQIYANAGESGVPSTIYCGGNYCTLQGHALAGTFDVDGDHDIIYGGWSGEKITITGDDCAVAISGQSEGNDYVYSTGDRSNINVERGNNTVYAGGEAATIICDSGNDSIVNKGNYATINCGWGNDSVFNDGDFVSIDGGSRYSNYFENNGDHVYIVNAAAASIVNTGDYLTVAGNVYFLNNSGNHITIPKLPTGACVVNSGSDISIAGDASYVTNSGSPASITGTWGIVNNASYVVMDMNGATSTGDHCTISGYGGFSSRGDYCYLNAYYGGSHGLVSGNNCTVRVWNIGGGANHITLEGSAHTIIHSGETQSITGYQSGYVIIPEAGYSNVATSGNNLIINGLTLVDYVVNGSYDPVTLCESDGSVITVIGA